MGEETEEYLVPKQVADLLVRLPWDQSDWDRVEALPWPDRAIAVWEAGREAQRAERLAAADALRTPEQEPGR